MIPSPPRPGDRRPRALPPGRRTRRRPGRPPAVIELEPRRLLSLNIEINYDHDASHFFDTQAKRDLMQEVADALGATIQDPLAAITPAGADHWTADFSDPATGAETTVPDLAVPANTIIVYVGAHALGGSEAGFGGPGGYSFTDDGDDTTWGDLVRGRGRPGAVGSRQTQMGEWGGSIAFDNTHTNFYFGADPAGIAQGQTDFASVAAHELGHVLGIGDTVGGSPWERYVSPGGFVGPASVAADGGQVVPLQAPDGGHWAPSQGSDGGQAVMAPYMTFDRNVFSSLDYAGLQDLGWTVTPPSRFQFSAATYATDPGGASVAITVNRVGPLDQPAAINYWTGDGPAADAPTTWAAAAAGVDYVPASGTLTFAAGQSVATFAVATPGAAAAPGDRQFHISLGDPNDIEAAGFRAATTVDIVPPAGAGMPSPGGLPSTSGGPTATVAGGAPGIQTLTLPGRSHSPGHPTHVAKPKPKPKHAAHPKPSPATKHLASASQGR